MSPALPRLLADRDAYQQRLKMILPGSVTGSSVSANAGAGAAAFTMMYVGAIDGVNPVRPLAFVRMSDDIGRHRTDSERREYYLATTSSRGSERIDALCDAWGVPRKGFYASNSREGPRDETFRVWEANGALIRDHAVATTSAKGRYSLPTDFAALLDPELTGVALENAITAWQVERLGPIARARAIRAATRSKAESAVIMHEPGGGVRTLSAGGSSEILRDFVELAVPSLLAQPLVIFVSESGNPVGPVDNALLKQLGLDLARLRLLPDCLLLDLDVDRGELWFVEVVKTDGPIHDARKQEMLRWATDAGLKAEQCRFLTAFASRAASPAKRALPNLARGSFAWFADEPDALLAWDDLYAL